VPIKDVAKYSRNPCHYCYDYTSVFADMSVGFVGALEGWSSVLIRDGREYFNMNQDFMEIMEDPKPCLELVGKLIETKHKNNAEHFLEVCKKFNLGTGIRNEKI
jgi:F420H2 dehydrogenase subunit F